MNARELCQYGERAAGVFSPLHQEMVISELKHGLVYKLVKAVFVLGRKNNDS